MRDVLPENVFQAIQDQFRSGCARGEAGWDSGKEEEDTLTGDLCGSLRTEWIEMLDETRRLWRFRISYKKFRGRGAGAEEKVFGTDGIVEVQIENLSEGTKFSKGLLFQAKKRGARDKKKLLEQAQKMEKIVQNGSAVFEYGAQGYIGSDAATFTPHADERSDAGKSHENLGDYLAGKFLPCGVGKRGMFYDAVGKSIVYPDGKGSIVRARVELKHRLRIEITAE